MKRSAPWTESCATPCGIGRHQRSVCLSCLNVRLTPSEHDSINSIKVHEIVKMDRMVLGVKFLRLVKKYQSNGSTPFCSSTIKYFKFY